MEEEKINSQVETSFESKKKPKRKTWKIIALVSATVVLAFIAVLSAIKLYQLRERQIAPTAPEKAPAAEEQCTLNFTIPSPTSTASPTETPTGTLEPTNTPTNTPTGTLEPTNTPTNTPTGTLEPTNTPTNTPTGTPAPTDTPTNTPTGTLVPTSTPTGTQAPTSTPTNTPQPTQVIAEGPTPTTQELPEAGVNFPVQIMLIFGSIITLSGLLIWL